MAQNDTSNVAHQRGQELKITKRTVSFGNNVYQFKNITGFSEGKIEKTLPIPWGFIFIGFIVSLIIMGSVSAAFGVVVLVACVICLGINLSQSDEYGLILTLNSGGKHMFVTSDHKMLSDVVQKLYKFMESDQDSMPPITINDNSIQIQGNMTGVAASGIGSSTISSNVSHSEDEE